VAVVHRRRHRRGAVLGEPTALSRMGVYTIGFFLCWAFAASSSAFTCFLQRGSKEINR
jgi:hypothetical protein